MSRQASDKDTKRGTLTHMARMSLSDSPHRQGGPPNPAPEGYPRERSASNRNLPEAHKLSLAQPRRASDEVAASSSHRLVTRTSPATSRRSISVMNVMPGGGGEGSPAGLNRLPSRLGSQTNIMKIRRESGQFQHQRSGSTSGSPSKYGSPKGSVSRAPSDLTTTTPSLVGTTPSGRRSSLAGIQSMSGMRSQKSSQSDATDHESPHNVRRSRESSLVSQQAAGLAAAQMADRKPVQRVQQQQHPPELAGSSPATTHQSCSSNAGSRRGSSSEQPPRLERKGSLAHTLRKLKRTMSLNKGAGSPTGSNQDSRRSSLSSSHSASELGEDVAVARPVKSGECKGSPESERTDIHSVR